MPGPKILKRKVMSTLGDVNASKMTRMRKVFNTKIGKNLEYHAKRKDLLLDVLLLHLDLDLLLLLNLEIFGKEP